MWPWIIEWILARVEWGVAGAMVACAAANCGGAGSQHAAPPSSDPAPPIATPAPADSRAMEITADSYHQCYAEAWLRGPSGQQRKYRFLLDSGDSDKLTINRKQAGQLGFDVAGLSFDQERETANGIGKAAKIEMPEFRMSGPAGSYRISNVEAEVDYNGMGAPLIGAGILTALNFHLGENLCTLTLPQNAAARRPVRSASVEPPRTVAPAAPSEPLRAANGEPMDGICQFFVRNREVSIFADSAAYCDKYGH